MPHLTASASSSTTSTAFAISSGHLAGGGRVAFRRPGAGSRPPPLLRSRSVPRNAAAGTGRGVGATEQPTFYEVLEISSEGSFEEVRAAYRRMARKYHPDVSPPGAAAENTRRFIEVQEAYETLSDPSRRASYDRALARGICRLAFSSASRRGFYEEEKSCWRSSWEDQVAELKRRSMRRDSEENLTWGARMRRRMAESSAAE